jgi:hypothetical protein
VLGLRHYANIQRFKDRLLLYLSHINRFGSEIRAFGLRGQSHRNFKRPVPLSIKGDREVLCLRQNANIYYHGMYRKLRECNHAADAERLCSMHHMWKGGLHHKL